MPRTSACASAVNSLGDAICARLHGNLHGNLRRSRRAQSQSARSRRGQSQSARSRGGQSQSGQTLGERSHLENRSSNNRQIRRRLLWAIPIPTGNPIPILTGDPIPTGNPIPIPTGDPIPTPTGNPRPNSTVSTRCPTEGDRALHGSADWLCPAPSAAADAADKLAQVAALSAADNTGRSTRWDKHPELSVAAANKDKLGRVAALSAADKRKSALRQRAAEPRRYRRLLSSARRR